MIVSSISIFLLFASHIVDAQKVVDRNEIRNKMVTSLSDHHRLISSSSTQPRRLFDTCSSQLVDIVTEEWSSFADEIKSGPSCTCSFNFGQGSCTTVLTKTCVTINCDDFPCVTGSTSGNNNTATGDSTSVEQQKRSFETFETCYETTWIDDFTLTESGRDWDEVFYEIEHVRSRTDFIHTSGVANLCEQSTEIHGLQLYEPTYCTTSIDGNECASCTACGGTSNSVQSDCSGLATGEIAGEVKDVQCRAYYEPLLDGLEFDPDAVCIKATQAPGQSPSSAAGSAAARTYGVVLFFTLAVTLVYKW